MSFLKTAMETMEIPPDTFPGCPCLRLYGNQQLQLENIARIIDYSDIRLLLQCQKNRIEICGRKLLIRQYSQTGLTVTGFIEKISFL